MEQVLYPLPEGWEWNSVKKLSHNIQYGHTAKAESNGNAKFLRITDIQDGKIEWQGVPTVSLEEKEISKYALNDDDLVFARSGATAGKSILIKNAPKDAVFASYLIRIIPNQEKILPEYLSYFFLTPTYWGIVSQNAAGAAQPNINGSKLSEFIVPVASKEEQKRIVEKLDALLTRINTAIEHLQESLTLTDSMFVSGMDKAFNPLSLPPNETGLYELPKEWVWQNLGSISTIGTGVTPLKGRADYYNNGHISWVTSKATGDDFVSDSEQKITEVALSECRLKLFPVGTLIVALYGQGKTRGQVSELLIESTINQALAAVVVNPDHNSKFVKYFLKRSYLLLRSKASGGTQENLNLSIIKAIQVPLPDTQQQRKIVLSLDALNDQINQVKIELTLKIELLNQLKASILDSAFKGEL